MEPRTSTYFRTVDPVTVTSLPDERRQRDIDHIMRCTKVGCTRCTAPSFEMRRIARRARMAA